MNEMVIDTLYKRSYESFDEMINEAEIKAVFVDSNANKLDPEDVKRMVKEEGAILKKSAIHE